MTEVFVVRNQLGQYWGKKKRWVDGTKPRTVAHFKHEDEGLNQLVELSSKDIELRGEVASAPLDERGVPVIEPSEHLIPDEDDLLTETGAGTAEATDTEAETTKEDAKPADAGLDQSDAALEEETPPSP